MNDALLMLFVRNARIGKVKTRLAATIGDEAALKIYVRLLEHTSDMAADCKAHKAVFYSEVIEEADEFPVHTFRKHLQFGDDLGERMQNAFMKGFSMGYSRVVIIGSDCYELNTAILDEAFAMLKEKDVVVGPAEDGGYYLLGMRSFIKEVFRDKEWSTDNVLLDTLIDLQKKNVSFGMLPRLRDVDVESDLGDLRSIIDDHS